MITLRRAGIVLLLVGAAAARPTMAQPAQPATEEVELALPPGVAFEVMDVGAGAVKARSPLLLSIRRARLAPGKALRVSVSLDPATAPNTRVSFRPGGSRGGTCRAGSLLPGIGVPVFESHPGLEAGSCELRWSLDSAGSLRRAGSLAITLRWTLESVAVAGSERRPAGDTMGRGGPLGGDSRASGALPGGEPATGQRPRRPGRAEPPPPLRAQNSS